MRNRDFSNLGRLISRAARQAMRSQDLGEIRNTVNNTFHEVVETISQPQPGPAPAPQPAPPKEKQKVPGSTAGVLCLVFGFLGLGLLVLGFSVLGAFSLFTAELALLFAELSLGLFLPLALAAAVVTGVGFYLRARAKRYRRYLEELHGCDFCAIDQLAESAGQPEKRVLKDLKRMIAKGVLPEAKLDEQETCIMLDEETYAQYLKAQESMRERQQLEEERRRKAQEQPEVHAVVSEGQEYIRRIRKANDDLPGEEVSQKLDRLEEVSSKIFDYVEQHPEKLPEIRRFMNYYLPTTLKLVGAYQRFEEQPVQGETITAAKAEILETFDTINVAFENLFDRLFQEDALDISTDISALETMLANEGLTGSDFQGRKPSGGGKE